MIKMISMEKFIYKSFIYDYSLESIVQTQYELSKKGIDIITSSNMPIFEFEAYTQLVFKDLKEEAESPRL